MKVQLLSIFNIKHSLKPQKIANKKCNEIVAFLYSETAQEKSKRVQSRDAMHRESLQPTVEQFLV
jgi:translation initiation factor RLI1